MVLDDPEPDLGRLHGDLLVDEGVLGAGVEVPEGPFEPASFPDGRSAAGEVGPLTAFSGGVVA